MRSGFILSGALALLALCGAVSAEPSRPSPSPPPAAAQTADDAEAAFVQWLQPLIATLDRAGQATMPFMQINFDFPEDDVQAALAAVREMSRSASAARSELANTRAALNAIQPFSHPQASAQLLELSTVLLRDSRASIENMDSLLGDIIDFAAAIERRDVEAVERITPRVERAAVVLVHSQATMLRARQHLTPAGSSTFHSIGSMAAFYDGMAALLASEKDFDVTAVDAAVTALDSSTSADRAAQILQRASISPRDPDYALATQIFDVEAEFTTVCERARTILATVAQEARAGGFNDQSRFAHLDELARIEYEMQELNRRQIELYGRLVQQ